MDEFEKQLRGSLAREAAPPDFLDKVLARTIRGNLLPWWKRRAVLAAIAAGTAVAVIVPAGMVEQRHRQAEDAHRQLLLAFRITHEKLVWTKQKLERKHP